MYVFVCLGDGSRTAHSTIMEASYVKKTDSESSMHLPPHLNHNLIAICSHPYMVLCDLTTTTTSLCSVVGTVQSKSYSYSSTSSSSSSARKVGR